MVILPGRLVVTIRDSNHRYRWAWSVPNRDGGLAQIAVCIVVDVVTVINIGTTTTIIVVHC